MNTCKLFLGFFATLLCLNVYAGSASIIAGYVYVNKPTMEVLNSVVQLNKKIERNEYGDCWSDVGNEIDRIEGFSEYKPQQLRFADGTVERIFHRDKLTVKIPKEISDFTEQDGLFFILSDSNTTIVWGAGMWLGEGKKINGSSRRVKVTLTSNATASADLLEKALCKAARFNAKSNY